MGKLKEKDLKQLEGTFKEMHDFSSSDAPATIMSLFTKFQQSTPFLEIVGAFMDRIFGMITAEIDWEKLVSILEDLAEIIGPLAELIGVVLNEGLDEMYTKFNNLVFAFTKTFQAIDGGLDAIGKWYSELDETTKALNSGTFALLGFIEAIERVTEASGGGGGDDPEWYEYIPGSLGI